MPYGNWNDEDKQRLFDALDGKYIMFSKGKLWAMLGGAIAVLAAVFAINWSVLQSTAAMELTQKIEALHNEAVANAKSIAKFANDTQTFKNGLLKGQDTAAKQRQDIVDQMSLANREHAILANSLLELLQAIRDNKEPSPIVLQDLVERVAKSQAAYEKMTTKIKTLHMQISNELDNP